VARPHEPAIRLKRAGAATDKAHKSSKMVVISDVRTISSCVGSVDIHAPLLLERSNWQVFLAPRDGVSVELLEMARLERFEKVSL
jgi:hypothetical protein